jgi:hypothetical protein
MGWWRADAYTQDGNTLRLDAVTLGTAADAERAAILAFRRSGFEPSSDIPDVFDEISDDGERYLVPEGDQGSGFFPCEKAVDGNLEGLRKPNDIRRR